MTKGSLRAVVCTSTLDLGIDWGAVDKVICIGAPKGAARLVQRIGRANHRLDEPSAALLVPANRFEVLECNAARDAVLAGELDGERLKAGGAGCAGPACAGHGLRRAVRCRRAVCRSAQRLALCAISRARISTRWWISSPPAAMRCAPMTAMRGCARRRTASLRLAHPRLAQEYRLNAGVIVEDPMVEIRLQGKRQARRARAAASWASWRNISSSSFRPATPSSLPARCCASKACARPAPMSPRPTIRKRKSPATMAASFRFPPFWPSGCARWCRRRNAGHMLPEPVQEWLKIQEWRSVIPKPGQLAGRDLSARQPPLSGLLSLRRPAGAPDPGHAADAAAGAAAPASAGLCRQ